MVSRILETKTEEEKHLYNVGIERAFISCLLKHPQLVRSAQTLVPRDCIYSNNYGVLYKTILDMKERYDLQRQDYDFNTCLIYRWIDASPELREEFSINVGKIEYIESILKAPDANHESFNKYVEIIKETAVRVKAYRMSFAIQNRAFTADTSDNTNKVIQDLDDMFKTVRAERSGGSIVRLGDCVEELIQDSVFNKANKGRVGIYIPTMPRLMQVINGIRRTQFIIVFARPKTGKSSWLLNIGLEVVKQDIPVLYIDTEMSQKEQASRALSNMSSIKEWDIMDGSFLDDKDKSDRLDDFADRLKRQDLFYCAAKGMDTDNVVAIIREFVDKYVGYETLPNGNKKTKPCLVVYDWLKVADSDSLQKVKEYQELGFIATKLQDTRRELDVPIIAGAQANRMGNEKEVGTNAAFNAQNFLADSDRLLRFCTCLIWLRRLNSTEMTEMLDTHVGTDAYYNQMVHVLDQRGGPICLDGIGLHFHGETLTYAEKDKQDLSQKKKKRRTEEEKDAAEKAKMDADGEKYAEQI